MGNPPMQYCSQGEPYHSRKLEMREFFPLNVTQLNY